ncbi:MAG: hypothetical protein MUC97_16175 [Bernardetiaceae bacterium]|jgi:hypothetical protein|nr:hypothetical protein [Bernardetiaceae bacterium]
MESKYKLVFIVIVCLGLAARPAHAQEQITKNFSEKYAVSASDMLDLSNRYGKVHVNTWDKNEITVDVQIKAWGRTQERAKQQLDRIKINYGKRGGVVFYETVVEDNNINIGNKSGFEINYTVSMPRRNRLKLYNRYGAAFLADHSGELDLSVRYGKFVGEKLTGPAKKIEVAYGGLELQQLEQGTIDISYSGGSIEKGGNITLDNRYTTVRFGSVGTLNAETKYGGLEIDNQVDVLKATMGYSGLKIGQLNKELVVVTKYANSFQVRKVAKSFSRIDVDANYSSVTLFFEAGTAFGFDVSTRYGNFKNDLPGTDLRRQIEQNTSNEVEGSVGKGGGTVKATANYGSVRFAPLAPH